MAAAGVFTAIFAAALLTVRAAPMCEDIFPPLHGKLTISPDNSFYIVRCEPGFAINGSFVVRCINGQWNHLPPKCVPDPLAKTCPEAGTPENGDKACPDGPQYVGSHCRFHCQNGYKLVGLELRICLPSTRWSGIPPRCIPITNQTCPVPPPLKNGRIIGCSPKRVPTVGKTCHFHCKKGYELEGPPTVYCLLSGKLTDADGQESFPKCKAVISSESQSDEVSTKDDKLQDSSPDVLRPLPTSLPSARNMSDQTLYNESDNDSNKPRYSSCEDSNGGCQQQCTQNRSGLIQCSCSQGYTLATDGKSCVDMRCPSKPTPDHASMKCKFKRSALPQTESYPVGSVCTIECTKGFMYTASTNKIKCQEDGTWSESLHECKPQQCEVLPAPENGEVQPPSCHSTGGVVKQKCTFTCHPGYKLKGKPVVTCRNDLTWSVKEIPRCQPEKSRPAITCPEDVFVDLLPGAYSHNITLTSPLTNLESVEIEPGWVRTGVPVEFPAGTTNVVFKASNKRQSVECTTTVHLIDREAPVFDFCPESFEVTDETARGTQVTWREPIANDNVEIESLVSTLQPNSILYPGRYPVEYFAKDFAGNVASCTFEISVL